MQLYQKLGNIFPFAENVPPAAKTHHIERSSRLASSKLARAQAIFVHTAKVRWWIYPKILLRSFLAGTMNPRQLLPVKLSGNSFFLFFLHMCR